MLAVGGSLNGAVVAELPKKDAPAADHGYGGGTGGMDF